MVAVGRGAQSGVLIKNAEARERREGVPHASGRQNRHAKQGQPSVAAIKPAPGIEAARLLRLAASLQRHCEHPLGAAIVRAAERRRLQGGARVGKGITGPIARPPDPGRTHAGRCRHRGAEADRRWPPPMSAWPRRGTDVAIERPDIFLIGATSAASSGRAGCPPPPRPTSARTSGSALFPAPPGYRLAAGLVPPVLEALRDAAAGDGPCLALRLKGAKQAWPRLECH